MENLKTQLKNYYGWNQNKVDSLVTEYERFLYIRDQYNQCSPSDEIDLVWHQHI